MDHIIDPSEKCLPVVFNYKVINLSEGSLNYCVFTMVQ